MESAKDVKVTQRQKLLEEWLMTKFGSHPITLQPMPGDASFRQYFRLYENAHSYVVMDAPPPENCGSFVAIANALRSLGLNTPDIIHAELEKGFLVLTDFGDTTYLKGLTPDNADSLYTQALMALATLQACPQVAHHAMPYFTKNFMLQEWAWHKEWFLTKLLGLVLTREQEKVLDACYHQIIDLADKQPQVFMHRDYHSANLMVLEQGVGILDFQDAFIGPVTYDLVSLLRDCYIAWPEERVKHWVLLYWDKLHTMGVLSHVSQHEFLQWFDWMGIQRHLKALLTFGRKHVRDHQSSYLKHVPRTLNYLLTVSAQYPSLRPLHHYLRDIVEPTFTGLALCVR